tara:strand:- start:528 stop:1133 length:606 start_codon:yes stop_codon:yes gene_type:complete
MANYLSKKPRSVDAQLIRGQCVGRLFPFAIPTFPSQNPCMLLHFNRDGQAFGPYPLEEAREYLKRGQILPSDQAWYEGCPNWMPVVQVPGMIGGGATDTPPPPPPPSAAPAGPVVLVSYSNATNKFNKKFFQTELARFLKLNPEGQTEQLFMRVRTGEEYALYRVAKTEGDHCVIQVDIDGVRKDKRVDYFNINDIEIHQR